MGVRTAITENNFSKNNTTSYKLSFLLGEDSFFYCIQDKGEVLLFKEFQQDSLGNRVSLATDLSNFLVSDKNLSLPFQEVNVAFAGTKSCFIPSRLFHPTKTEVYLRQLTPLESSEQIKTEDLSLLQTHHVFGIEKTLWNAIKRTFPNAVCRHIVSSLSVAFLKIAKTKAEKQVFINTRDQKAQIFIFEHDQLLFNNTFRFQSSKDFIYYVLLIYEQLKLSTESHPLWISGAIVENSEIYRLLYRYIQEINLMELPDGITLGPQFEEQIPPHFYFDLFTI